MERREITQPEFPNFGQEVLANEKSQSPEIVYEQDDSCEVCGGGEGGCNQCGYTGKRGGRS